MQHSAGARISAVQAGETLLRRLLTQYEKILTKENTPNLLSILDTETAFLNQSIGFYLTEANDETLLFVDEVDDPPEGVETIRYSGIIERVSPIEEEGVSHGVTYHVLKEEKRAGISPAWFVYADENDAWEKIPSRTLPYHYSLLDEPIEEIQRLNNANAELLYHIASTNLVAVRSGISEKQMQSIRALAPILDYNPGLLRVEVVGEYNTPILTPHDGNWRGLVIAADESGIARICVHLCPDVVNTLRVSQGKIPQKERWIAPVSQKDIDGKVVEKLLQKTLRARRGKMGVATIPLSEEVVVIATGTRIETFVGTMWDSFGFAMQKIEKDRQDTLRENMESVEKELRRLVEKEGDPAPAIEE